MITKSRIVFCQMIKQISRDMMLWIMCFVPFLAGAAIRFAVPMLEHILCEKLGYDTVMAPYYCYIDWLLALLPGIMYAFVGGLVALGELDDKIAGYMAVTPVGNTGYLLSRLGYPSCIALFISMITVKVFGLSGLGILEISILSAGSALLGVMTALIVIAISSNKVEGMAIGKLSGLVSIGIYIPVLFNSPLSYLGGILPSFWIGKLLLGLTQGNTVMVILGICFFAVTYFIWMKLLLVKYGKKVMI